MVLSPAPVREVGVGGVEVKSLPGKTGGLVLGLSIRLGSNWGSPSRSSFLGPCSSSEVSSKLTGVDGVYMSAGLRALSTESSDDKRRWPFRIPCRLPLRAEFTLVTGGLCVGVSREAVFIQRVLGDLDRTFWSRGSSK
jgi:hypothetical protein